MTSKPNWLVTTYNDMEKRTGCFKIENRTEREATKEAEASVSVREAHDWTLVRLTPIKKRKWIASEREKQLLRMAVIYAIPNLDDVIEAFSDYFGSEEARAPYCVARIFVDGCPMQPPTEEEMSELLKHF